MLRGDFDRAQQHVGVAAFETRLAFDGAVLGEVAGEAEEQLLADVDVGDFASAELDYSLDAIALFEEPDSVVLLEIVIVIVRVRAELEFLDLDDVLFALRVVLLLLVFVLPLAVIHGFGHGGIGGGGDQDEIEAHILGFTDSLLRRHNLDGPVGENRAHFASANGFIYVLPDSRPARGKSSWNHPREPQSRSKVFMTK